VGELTSAQKAEVLTEQIDDALDALKDQLAQGHTEAYLEVLDFYSKFWKYSLGNSILIAQQKPKASLVAGFKKWRELGFTVKHGEPGLAIRAPWLRKHTDPETGEIEQRLIGYLVTYVWDISQTAEYPLKQAPTIFKPVPGSWYALYEHLLLYTMANGVAVTNDPMPHGIHGMYSNSHIYVNERLEPYYKVATCIHEYVHHVAHGKPELREGLTRDQREWEAESCVYVICKCLGIEHETARDYLLSYHFTTEDLEGSIKKIQGLVKQVMKDLDLRQETTAVKETQEAVAA
jgi:hypothetical protein